MRQAGYTVLGLPDGTGFATAVDTFRPDVAVLDVMIPGGSDGLQLGRALRQRCDAALLFLTATGSDGNRAAVVGVPRAEPRQDTVQDQILTQVWGYDSYDLNLVEVFVSTLRRKTADHGTRMIHTVRGNGVAPAEPDKRPGPLRPQARGAESAA